MDIRIMSDLLYKDVPINGVAYKPGDWRKYAIHNEENVCGFFGPYRWLSNFWKCPVLYHGIVYPSSENAYQAAKIIPEQRGPFLSYSPEEAKTLWRENRFTKLYTREELDEKKFEIMFEILILKFIKNEDLKYKLRELKDRYLEETNHWCDNFYGSCICEKCGRKGKNRLGEALMFLSRII
jgi:predicted NAD-dependent protein-ADP-ribosyltransferase YbiA (DUF1768 family)